MWNLLTSKFAAIFAGILLVLSLGLLGEQEISLRHALAVANKSLDSEIQCRVGSTCATKLAEEAARGAALVDQERAQAASAAAAAEIARQQQAEAAVRQQQSAVAQATKDALTWKQKYTQALQTPSCELWAKQAVSCSVH